jgi:16S rRNA G966 N2-methylase RsmD
VITQARLFEIEHPRTPLDLLAVPRTLRDFAGRAYAPGPNVALADFVQVHALEPGHYTLKPLLEELVAGKNTYVYDAHTYHTKVPPQAIARLIEHYAAPGGLVLDPFCGSGMTGVAALQTGRTPILIDLSPAATFIAFNFVTPIDAARYTAAFEAVLAATADEALSMYGTHCRTCGKLVPMNYMVWSYGLLCKHCRQEFVLWDVARDEHADVRKSKIKAEFDCPHCGKPLKKSHLCRTQPYPVQVGYHCCDSDRRESTAIPDAHDRALIKTLDAEGIPGGLWYPTSAFPPGLNTRQPISHGLTSIDALYTTRQLRVMARLWDIARRWCDAEIGLKLMYTVTSLYQRVTQLSEFRFWGGSSNTANYNVPMIFNEQNVFQVFERKAKTIQKYFATWDPLPIGPFCISTQSATDLSAIPGDTIDYIFTDPPFGGNINYSEMNYLWESWLGVFTHIEKEAIINRVQGKSLDEYQDLMTQSFSEMHRVLKPGCWLTVMFHNSSAKVWSALQQALATSGFSIETTQTLDKQHGTFKQFVSPNAVGYDLLLHCRKETHNASAVPTLHNNGATKAAIRVFVKNALAQAPEDFVVHYLHVERQDEVDSRKLYALWLKERLEAEEMIDVSYEEFRKILVGVMRSEVANHLGKGGVRL